MTLREMIIKGNLHGFQRELGKSDLEDSITGRGALWLAAFHNRPEMIDLLIGSGGDQNRKDFKSWTPAMAAVWNGSLAALKVLHHRSANIMETDALGRGLCHIAAFRGHGEVLKWLLSNNVPFPGHQEGSPIKIAIEGGDLDSINFLLNNGFDTSTSFEEEVRQVLKMFSEKKLSLQVSLNILKSLKKHGADDNETWHALADRGKVGDMVSIALLIKAGWDIGRKSQAGETVDVIAMKNGFQEIGLFLVSLKERELLSTDALEPNVSRSKKNI